MSEIQRVEYHPVKFIFSLSSNYPSHLPSQPKNDKPLINMHF
ncbi:hypothetical protein GAGA_3288 [Paraglaciecola agarilytica NO2]|uniref:Uncharacterized protein n=1 Tax=Paraglaciecola agarilytica NO2 TaxID=1125747 RepID=A0ABQ0IA07_9ALTE|nr:hypothetical protein GAGA_3288 [Paraglaciecola agarilytica NO2]